MFIVETVTRQSTQTVYKKDESSVLKHTRFWDKSNKGYITPLDTISGFITLGYGMIFSIAVGTFVGVVLSLSTQEGWIPDPLCRSKVNHLIKYKRHSATTDEEGVFNSDRFDSLFNKYAKADSTKTTMTITEFIQMTKDQEKTEKPIIAWTSSLIELITTYFFIGHRGSLSKDDVRAAYDGTLFYRLRDENRFMIEDKKNRKTNVNKTLKGSYLSKPSSVLSPKQIEHQLTVMLSSLQSKYSLTSEYGMNDWVSYIQERTDSIKNRALRRPTSMIHGVATPKLSGRKVEDEADEPTELFPEGLTGVLKEKEISSELTKEDYLSNLLSKPTEESESESTSQRGVLFSHLTKNDNQFVTSSGLITVNASNIQHSPSSETFQSSYDSTSPFQSGILRSDNEDYDLGLTGILRHTSDEDDQKYSSEQEEENDEVSDDLSPPELPESTITPPPEEKESKTQVNQIHEKPSYASTVKQTTAY